MVSSKSFVALLALCLPISAHFDLEYPEARGENEDDLGTGPCGGFDKPSSERTSISMTSLAISTKMGHDESAVSILLGLGNDPSSFNITLLPTFRQEGLGDFCLASVPIPSDLGIEDGTNGTIQVITNGDPTGGLYACADVRFTMGTVAPSSSCSNGTGVTAQAFSGEAAARVANESTAEGEAQQGASGTSTASQSASGSATGVASGSAATNTQNAGMVLAPVGWGLLSGLFLGAAAIL